MRCVPPTGHELPARGWFRLGEGLNPNHEESACHEQTAAGGFETLFPSRRGIGFVLRRSTDGSRRTRPVRYRRAGHRDEPLRHRHHRIGQRISTRIPQSTQATDSIEVPGPTCSSGVRPARMIRSKSPFAIICNCVWPANSFPCPT